MAGRIIPAPNTSWFKTQIRCRTCDDPLYRDHADTVWTCVRRTCENYLLVMTKEGKPSEHTPLG